MFFFSLGRRELFDKDRVVVQSIERSNTWSGGGIMKAETGKGSILKISCGSSDDDKFKYEEMIVIFGKIMSCFGCRRNRGD